MYKIVCEECGKSFIGKNEYDAEVKWNAHECEVNYDELSFEELRKLAYGEF